MAETNVSINGRIEKDNLVHRYHRILYNHKSWALVICKIMNGTRSYQVRQVRHRKTNNSYFHSYMGLSRRDVDKKNVVGAHNGIAAAMKKNEIMSFEENG